MIYPGMLIRTNYSGPYRVVTVKRGCTCSRPLDIYNMDYPPATEPHIHLALSREDGTGRFYLGWFIESELRSINMTYCGKTELDYDRIEILPCDQPVQLDLFK